jgi:hypothetical protein
MAQIVKFPRWRSSAVISPTVYCRSTMLAMPIFWRVPEDDRLDPVELRLLYGDRRAVGAVLRTRSIVKELLDVEIRRGEARSFLYDVNRHLNFAHVFREETKLAGILITHWRQTRRAA